MGEHMERLEHLSMDVVSAHYNDVFDLTRYRNFIAYSEKHNLLDTESVWKCKFKYEPLTPENIEIMLAVSKRPGYGSSFHFTEYLMGVYPTVKHALQSDLPELERLYKMFQFDFVDGQLVFDLLVDKLTASEDYTALKALYDSRLGVPHRQYQSTYDSYSSLISAHFKEEYTTLMRAASKKIKDTEDAQRFFERLEQNVSEAVDSPEPWIEYIRKLSTFKHINGSPMAPTLLFFRSLYSGSCCKIRDPSWYGVWVEILHYLSQQPSVLPYNWNYYRCQFLNAFPDDVRAFAEVARMHLSERDILSLWNRASNEGLFRKSEETASFAMDLLYAGYRLSPYGSNSEMDSGVLTVVYKACEVFSKNPIVVDLALRILVSSQKEYMKNDFNRLAQLHMENNPKSANAWLISLDALTAYKWADPIEPHMQKMMQYVEEFSDPPETLGRLENFVRVYASPATFGVFKKNLEKISKTAKRRRNIDEEDSGEIQSSGIAASSQISEISPDHQSTKKAKTQNDENVPEPTRSREQFRVKIHPVKTNVTEKNIRAFLRGYADPLSMTITTDVDNPDFAIAYVELGSEQEVLSSLTRQYKPLKGVTVNVERFFGTTVWATNYPSKYGVKELKNMVFELSGKHATDIRVPSQRDDKERRFFYADFADEQTAEYVREKLSGYILEGHELQAEISNPSLKKPKDLDPASHQIHLHNLNFKETTEETLRTHFMQWGPVANVYVPVSEVNKTKGYLNNGFAFVTFSNSDSASSAISQKKTQIDGRDVDISAVKPKKHTDKSRAGFEESKTITLKNVNQTVSEAQLKKLLEETVGPVSSLSLKPSKKMALVEFASVADTGKAGVALDGTEFEDNVLQVGLKKDFYKEEQVSNVPKMMPPMLMRKRKH